MSPLPRRELRQLGLLLAAGLVIRLLVVASTDGVAFDMGSFRAVEAALRTDGFGMYGAIHPSRWPYPPGYLPWVALAGELGRITPFDLQTWIRLPPILADLAIAVVVQDLLGRAGASPRRRLIAAGLVTLGPVFAGVSSFNGQLDPVAILPALLALWVWTRPGMARRALIAGLLIGVGAAIKTVPLLMILALAPSARSWREAATLASAAGAVLVASLAPFVATTPDEALFVFTYHGVPGFGGVSLLTQPSFAQDVLAGKPVQATRALLFMRDHGHQVVLLPALAALALLFARRRPDPVTASVLLWLVVWAFGANFFLQYLVWGLPFLVVRGHLRAVAAVQAGLLLALLATYNAPVGEGWALALYTVPIVLAWLAALAGIFAIARSATGGSASSPARPA